MDKKNVEITHKQLAFVSSGTESLPEVKRLR